jgi:hypothetical protein
MRKVVVKFISLTTNDLSNAETMKSLLGIKQLQKFPKALKESENNMTVISLSVEQIVSWN